MKFSEQWLRSFANPDISSTALTDSLSMAGLEVDDVQPAAADFSGVVVGQILVAEQHPQADKLQICTVTDGEQNWQVICGAPNARAGLITAFARIGAQLPGDFNIKKAKLRGVESFGMLCSGAELGINDDQDGILELSVDAPVGLDLRQHLNLDDCIIDVDLTPNRGDCLSVRGLAREVCAMHDVPFQDVDISEHPADIDAVLPVSLEAPEACGRYLGRIIKGVNLSKASPEWLVQRLQRSGLRSIDAVVDVTNYVMLELGQPMHAFDLAEVSSGIRVRFAHEQERIHLLDGQELTLSADTLVIADQDKALAIAGVMGGEHSGVTSDTQDIFLESAWFNPIALAGKARNYGLHTDSSHRFERGVDPELCVLAMHRATALLLSICGGQAGPVIERSANEHLPVPAQIDLSRKQITDLLGVSLDNDRVQQILAALGFKLVVHNDQTWLFQAPSWRFDMSISADLIEELARIYGYNRLPSTAPMAELRLKSMPEAQLPAALFRDRLLSLGYQEVITYSFVAADLQRLCDPEMPAIALVNPITAELAVMRTNLMAGLLKTLQYNQARQQSRIRLQETGMVFRGDLQANVLAGLLSGDLLPQGWSQASRKVDFYDAKADVEALLSLSRGQTYEFAAFEHPALHPGQAARISLHGEEVGFVGAVHPQVLTQLDLKGPVFVFELALAPLSRQQLVKAQSLSRFPTSSRDLALVLPESVSAADLLACIRAQAGPQLLDLVLFDQYQGTGIAEGFKSLAVQLSWQHPERTLAEDEVNQWVQSILAAVQSNCHASLR